VELVKGAPSTVDLSFNYDGRPEIGVWRATLRDDRFDAAVAELAASGYEALPGPSLVKPGAKLVSIGVRRAGERAPRMRGFPVHAPPPQLAPAVVLLDAAIAEIRQHPLRVLRGRAALGAARIDHGGDLSVDLNLTNAGIEPLHLSNPMASPAKEWNGIRLVFVDGHGGERSIDLTPAAVSSDSALTGASLSLAAGANVHLRVRTNIDWPAGAGHLRVEVHHVGGDSDDAALVDGTLWLDAGPLTIARASRWKLWQ
jgi:hypothetical protein